jgi:signal transduction histidine kinase/CheY-like chemotaxis protein/streptogramin lyase
VLGLFTKRRAVATLVAVVASLAGGSTPLRAQHYNFKFYGQEEGLQNLAVQIALQDREGFLWVGTQNGLFRYDGSRFKAFTRDDGLPGTRIESLHEAADGTLWVGTGTGLARRRGARFETVSLGTGAGAAHAVIGREGIASDPQGRLYVVTDRGLFAGTSKTATLTPVDHSAEAASVYLDQSGRLWYGCGTDLCVLENGSARAVGRAMSLPQARWDAILEDPAGALWVRSHKSLYMRARVADRFQEQAGVAASEGAYLALGLDSSGRLLVPTDDGLARRTARGWETVTVDDGLGSSAISAVFRDREGNIWLGLVGSGLARWLGYNEWQNWSDREGLSRSSVWSIASSKAGSKESDSHSTIWAGTQDGLDYTEMQDGRPVWKHRTIPGIGTISTVISGPDGDLWIGGDEAGLTRMDPRTGGLRRVGSADGLPRSVDYLMADRDGRVWASTRQGLYRTQALRKSVPVRFEQVLPPGTNASERFAMTAEDRNGNVWAAGDFGLARISGDKWTRYAVADGLKSNAVAQVAADADGSVWIGYRDASGITHLSFDVGRPVAGPSINVEHFNTGNNALRSNKTLFMGFDLRGWLWAGTDHGVDVFDHTRWRHFGRSDGLIWDDCNTNAFLAGEDGAVWIGTSRGLSRFEPQAVPPPNLPPQVVFTSITVGGTPLDLTSDAGVPWNRRPLQIRFAALTYANESDIAFRYRLGGDDTSWQETTERELSFPALPPHIFTLEVMARNGEGAWSVAPAKLSLQVQAPWWESAWFAGAMVVLLMVLARMILWRRTRRLVDERRTLEEAVKERTHALATEKARAEHEKAVVDQQKQEIERLLDQAKEVSRHKSEFLANMSHEIRTPMNGVLGMTNLVLATQLSEEQREYVETARLSADFLLTVLNDILDFSKIEAGRLDLSPVDFSLKDSLEQIGRMLSLQIANKKLEYSLSVAEDVPDRLVGDPDRLRQILINLVGNAIKFTDQGGVSISVRRQATVEVSAHPDGVTLLFDVRDSGVGIPKDKQDVIFDAFRQADGSTTRKYGGTGLGLAICSRLTEMMGGSIWVESEPGHGSTFHFSARLGVVTGASVEIDEQTRKLAAAVTAFNPEPVTNLTILIAEDNPVNQRLASKLLEKRGHRVTVTGTGSGAFQHIQDEIFDVVLMDVQMPDMDGLEATALIRDWEKSRGRRTPIIALTAHSMKGDRERCLAAGMDTYVTKPFDAVRLIEVVEATARLQLKDASAPVTSA